MEDNAVGLLNEAIEILEEVKEYLTEEQKNHVAFLRHECDTQFDWSCDT